MGLFASWRRPSSAAAEASPNNSPNTAVTPVQASPLWTTPSSSNSSSSFRIGRNTKSYVHATLSTNIDGTLVELETCGNISKSGPVALLRLPGSSLLAVVHKHGQGGFRISRPNVPYYPEQASVGHYVEKRTTATHSNNASTSSSTTDKMPLYPYAILDAAGNLQSADPHRVFVEPCCLVNGPLNSKEKYWTTIRGPNVGVVRLATVSYRATSQQHEVTIHPTIGAEEHQQSLSNNNNNNNATTTATVDYGLLILLTHLGDLRDTNKQLRRLAKATAQGSVLIS